MIIETHTGYAKGKGSIVFIAETSAEGAQLRELVKRWEIQKIPFNEWNNMEGQSGVSVHVILKE